ncbi:histone H1 [Solitalea sp. MAHUQ-68]|uniref:Histone H1 n=1 Tax=Solitalea agri TaxID=2953739 RepID=A0A9X2JB16_9SPHI|nr:histone H1 [Solitalea agri]MCO4291548.1 histone H1 [Solitalea agri]
MEKFKQLKDLIAAAEEDAAKFYEKSNGAAGTRLRKAMMDIKNAAQEIRNQVTEVKNKEK